VRSDAAPDLRYVDERQVGACYEVMRQLRPDLASAVGFEDRWRRQLDEGYRLLALWAGGRPRALAGFRVLESFVHGRFLYVDDLVTEEDERGRGHGEKLLARLEAEGRALGCRKLVLDTDLDNALAHRFYYRQGLLAMALRFSVALA
jgi:ribosomal protein S18 acetylase RimI-like enzyme